MDEFEFSAIKMNYPTELKVKNKDNIINVEVDNHMRISEFKRYLLGKEVGGEYFIDGPFFFEFNISNLNTVGELHAIAVNEEFEPNYAIEDKVVPTLNVFTDIDKFDLKLKNPERKSVICVKDLGMEMTYDQLINKIKE